MPIWYEGLEERQAKMRKKMPDLAWDDQEDEEFVDVEEITEKSNANWKTSRVKEEHSEISDGGIENLETVDRSGDLTGNLQDLPDELILKVLSYSKPKDLTSSGQVSKRLRSISYDNSLWQRVNISEKIVKTDFLELILNKGCKSLNLSWSNIVPSELISKVLSYSESKDLYCSGQVSKRLKTISWDIKSQLRELYLSGCCNEEKDNGLFGSCKNIEVSEEFFEELLASCFSLEKLEIQNWTIIPKVAASVCQNYKTLQTLNLARCDADGSSYLQQIIKSCQELKEIDLSNSFESDFWLEFLAKNISPNVEILNLSKLDITDNHVRILISRCKKIKVLNLGGTLITDDSLRNIGEKLNTTLEELSLGCIDDDYEDNRDKNISFTGLHDLKFMRRLKLLNLSFDHKNLKEDEIENLRHQLPPITELYIHAPIQGHNQDLNLTKQKYEIFTGHLKNRGPTVLHFSGMGGTQP